MRRCWTIRRVIGLAVAAMTVAASLAFVIAGAEAQQRRARPMTPQAPRDVAPPRPPAQTPAPAPAEETIQADVSARTVEVTSSFTGTEIVVFGAVDNSRQRSAQAGYYDLVIVIEGAPSRIVARRKDRVGGIWFNRQSVVFDGVPGFYAIASTRPVDEIMSADLLRELDIGYTNLRMVPRQSDASWLTAAELGRFREAIVRIKSKDKLFVSEDYGAGFIGRSLFRASLRLPANAPVGPFDTRVYLFQDQRLISQYNVRLLLERAGIERFLYTFAVRQPLGYGIATVALACVMGLFASALFRKQS